MPKFTYALEAQSVPSRKKALECAIQVAFYRLAGSKERHTTYDHLKAILWHMGFGVVTPAEMSDVWRYSAQFTKVKLEVAE